MQESGIHEADPPDPGKNLIGPHWALNVKRELDDDQLRSPAGEGPRRLVPMVAPFSCLRRERVIVESVVQDLAIRKRFVDKCRNHSYGPGDRLCATFHCGFLRMVALMRGPSRLSGPVPQWRLELWCNVAHPEGDW
jgi:hypothetical protein